MKDVLESSATATIALLRTQSLTGIVQGEIERMILSGELPAGARLNENALAAKLSVSRGPIREACRALAELGFVYLVPNRGVFVKRLSRTDVMEVYDMRAGLLGLACSLLAPVVTERQLSSLERLIEKMDNALAEAGFAAFYPFNVEFHDIIIESVGNGHLRRMYRGLIKECYLFRRHEVVEPDVLATSNEEHREIVAALRRHDARKCYDLSFKHIINSKERVLMALDDMADEEDAPESVGEMAARPVAPSE